jgi:putative endopeptidase
MSYTIKNFFLDVNKKWLSHQKIPANNSSVSYFDLIERNIHKQLIQIIQTERKKTGKFRDFIESFYTGFGNDMKVLELFVESLTNFSDHDGLMKSISVLNLYNLRSPIMLGFSPDMKDTSRYSVYIGEPDTGIRKPEYHGSNDVLKNYKIYLSNFAKAVNFHELATEFLEIERAITEFYPDPNHDVELEELYNPMTFGNLQSQFTHINFSLIFSAIGIDTKENIIYVVNNIKYLFFVDRLLRTKPLQFWKIWIKSSIYTSLHGLLPVKVRKSYFDFYQRFMKGQRNESSLDEQALSVCSDLVGDTIGQLYIASDLAKFQKIKAGTTEIIKMVKVAARARIMKLNWLSEGSKAIACHKLDKMNLKVAYPEKWYDDFKNVEIDSGQFLLNVLNLSKSITKYEISKITSNSVDDRKFWDSACFEVNAFYYSEMNEFCIPLGFLFEPFYSESMSFIQIVAGLGNIVGHEISHGFDKDGRKFDENGNNYPWWTSLDLELYHEKTKQIITLFNQEQYHGLPVNGELTLDENLADFGALAICLDVLHNSWASKPINEAEKKAQLREFFIWYSKTWAYKDTRAHQKLAVKTNVHAPAELRVNTLLPHFDEFYYAFDFDDKHEGYVAPENRVDVWGR